MRKITLTALFITCLTAGACPDATDSIASQQINELVVNGERPQVRGRDGIMTVDLPAIVRDKPVTNILEALGYLPGVVDNNGMIGLTGASSVTIILNGELTGMPVKNLYRLLYTMPVDRLKSVEVMYSAPAKYHVDGAVINVVLKTPRPLDGLQGQVRGGYHQAHYGSFGGAVAATYAVGDLTLDLNYGVSQTKSLTREETRSDHRTDGRHTVIEDDMRTITRNLSHTIFASVTLRGLKLTYNGQIVSDYRRRGLSSGTLGNFTNIYRMQSPVCYHNAAVRYTAPFGMTAGGDYTRYSENRSQSLFKNSEYLLGAHNRQSIHRYHVYVDQEHRSGGWRLDYGVEYLHSSDHSSQKYPDSAENDFDDMLKEDVVDAYIGTGASSDAGLSFNLSAKAEYYHNNYRHNWNFIPQLGATYSRTPASIFQLNLSTRRIYPSYWELHGGTSHINDYSSVIGNPGLEPYIQYDTQLNYIFKQKYVATLYLQYGDKATVQLPYQSPDELRLIFQTINMNCKRTVGLNLYAPFKANRIWDAEVTANIFSQREKADRFHDISFDNDRWVLYFSVNNSVRLGTESPLSLSLDFKCLSRSVQGIADLSGIWRLDAGLKWQFGRKRCCELVLKADDIFSRWSPTMTINTSGQNYRMKVRDMTRNLRLTFAWRFNGFKPKDTAIDTSRFGTGD